MDLYENVYQLKTLNIVYLCVSSLDWNERGSFKKITPLEIMIIMTMIIKMMMISKIMMTMMMMVIMMIVIIIIMMMMIMIKQYWTKFVKT